MSKPPYKHKTNEKKEADEHETTENKKLYGGWPMQGNPPIQLNTREVK